MRVRPFVALAALAALGCGAPPATRAYLTSAPVGPAARTARLSVPAGVDAFAVAVSAPDPPDVPGLLRAMADALDAMPQSRDRFAIAASSARADTDMIARSPRDETLFALDALQAALQAISDVTRGPATPAAIREAVDAGWLSTRSIRPNAPLQEQGGAFGRSLQDVARALVLIAAAWVEPASTRAALGRR